MNDDNKIIEASVHKLINDTDTIYSKVVELEGALGSSARTEDIAQLSEKLERDYMSTKKQLQTVEERLNSLPSTFRAISNTVDNSKRLSLSDDKIDYYVLSGECPEVKELKNCADRTFTKHEYLDTLQAIHDIKRRDQFKDKIKIYNSLSDRQREVVRLSLINEDIIQPEFFGILDCDEDYEGLESLYSHRRTRSVEYYYYQMSRDVTALAGTISSCLEGCVLPDTKSLDLVGRKKTGTVYPYTVKFVVPEMGKVLYYPDVLDTVIREAVRSYRWVRENFFISGATVGWLHNSLKSQKSSHSEGFPLYRTAKSGEASFTDVKTLLAQFTSSYRNLTVVLHPETMAYLSNEYTSNGRTLFDEPSFFSNASSIMDLNIRFHTTELVPSILDGAEKNGGKPLTGAFVCAVADWKKAYEVVDYQDLRFKYLQSAAFFCNEMIAGAMFGGNILCPQAGKILSVS